MEVADDDHLDVGDGVACEGDLLVEVHAGVVVDAGEDVLDGGADDFGVVISCAGFVEDEAFGWMLDEDGEHD